VDPSHEVEARLVLVHERIQSFITISLIVLTN
jgi:hypothetical protein